MNSEMFSADIRLNPVWMILRPSMKVVCGSCIMILTTLDMICT